MNCQLFQGVMKSLTQFNEQGIQKFPGVDENVALVLFAIEQGYKFSIQSKDMRGILVDTTVMDRDDIYIPADIARNVELSKYFRK
jgi:hypothetical protein